MEYKICVIVSCECALLARFTAPQLPIHEVVCDEKGEQRDCCFFLERAPLIPKSGPKGYRVEYSCNTECPEEVVTRMISNYFHSLSWKTCGYCSFGEGSSHTVSIHKQQQQLSQFTVTHKTEFSL